ncbi:Threonine--tRNA ligase [Dirofilaria immitis]
MHCWKIKFYIGVENRELRQIFDTFRESMFVVDGLKNEKLAIKRMNCSCHVQIFNSRTRSCLDLLILMTEFGTCHRNESSGLLHGLMQARG